MNGQKASTYYEIKIIFQAKILSGYQWLGMPNMSNLKNKIALAFYKLSPL